MSSEGSTIKCQTCNKPIEENAESCPFCGTPASPKYLGGSNSNEGRNYISGDEAGPAGLGFELPIVVGEKLSNKYRVIQELDKGGFGAVYEVDDTELNERLALKIVVDQEGKGRRACEQIRREFKLRKKISDTTHIIKTQDPRSCEYKGLSLVLLPMELADGGSMRKWLRHNRDIKERRAMALEFFKQACLGVKAMHEAEILHLDIKPENILLVDGKAQIADFGIGRYEATQFTDNPEQLLRQEIGTPQYMSPEQFHGDDQKNLGPSSDIYSLGVVLYELLSGSLPFDGTRDQLRQKHLHDAPVEIKGISAKYWIIVSRCLAKKVDDRYSSIDQLNSDLEHAAQKVIEKTIDEQQRLKKKPDLSQHEGKEEHSGILNALGHGLLWAIVGIFTLLGRGLWLILKGVGKALFFVITFVFGQIWAMFTAIVKTIFTNLLGGRGN